MGEFHGHTAELTSIAWHPGGRRIASASEDGSIRIWDVRSGQELLVFEPATLRRPFADAVCWSPDGRCLAAWQDDAVKIFAAPPDEYRNR
ncbi:MAG: hypothetical protein KatS3mg110_4495 [Pirellulaceae bacterium]|nr:MAG: hypothetical protein KatS3mg110_4495 [Pirellulaceae bacterium]